MRALILGEEQRRQIAALKERAATNPTPLRAVEALAKVPLGTMTENLNADMTIRIPDGFKVVFTHEEQRQCTCRHLSVSVNGARKGPHPSAVAMLMDEFGFINKLGALPCWQEPIGHGDFAINVLEPLDGDVGKLRSHP